MSNTVTAKYLIENAPDDIPMLVDPIIPKNSLSAIIGSSSSGKSSLARQLAMAICRGDNEFLGFGLSPVNKRVLYLSTEEDQEIVSPVIKEQFGEGEITASETFDLLFPNSENVTQEIENELQEKSYDLVIIDSFSDVITGDMNMSNIVRRQLNHYRNLAAQYSVSFLFIHHITKQSENQSPSKVHSMGSSGFEQKMRFVGELVSDGISNRSLHFVKGNYLNPEENGKGINLRVDRNRNVEKINDIRPNSCANHDSDKPDWRERAEHLYLDEAIQTNVQMLEALKAEGYSIGRSSVGKHFRGRFPKDKES